MQNFKICNGSNSKLRLTKVATSSPLLLDKHLLGIPLVPVVLFCHAEPLPNFSQAIQNCSVLQVRTYSSIPPISLW